MSQNVSLVDRGRGLQLSTSRITVQDLVPYFQDEATDDEIRRWIPSLTPEEIDVVRAYYSAHKEELDEQDRRIREWTEEQVRLQRERIPEFSGTPDEHRVRLRRLLQEREQERNGEGHPS